jgi:hypothetical protein
MTELVGKIAVLLGIGRDGKAFEKRKRRPGKVRRENDSVTISTEARRLLAFCDDEGAVADKAVEK